jgi:ERCC4-related helicase
MVEKKHNNEAHTTKKSVEWIQHPLIKDEKIESRLYQQVLAANALKNGNTMIVAPTALGKTIVAALVAAERLKKYDNSKVLVLAPSKPLVIQHEESFRQFLKTSSTSITGAIKPEERVKRWNDSQVVCATPQTVESDLISGRYNLENVSVLVFDECHRGVGSYSYVYLASKYMKEAKNPLVLGLTASPGWDEEKIQDVCENLFIEDVVIKNEDDSDVEPYFNPVDVKWIKIELNPELKDIKSHLEKALKVRLKTLKKMGVIRSISNVSKKDILKAKGNAQNRIGRSLHPPQKCFIAVSILTAVINILHSQELLETQGTTTLHKYLERLRKKKTKAARGLISDVEFQMAIGLTENAYKKGIDHPKLKKLMSILKKELKKSNSKIIIFTQFRDSVENILQHCLAEDINAIKFYGQASRENEKGLSQKKQKEIIKAFKSGEYDVLISTSVAEEGIDIPAVDLVILYEPVPSEIRMIQRRGRTGRKNLGKMFILITKGTRDESYYWSSINKEKKMKKHLSNNYKKDLNDFKVLKIDKPEIEVDNDKPIIYADSREGSSRVLRELEKLNVEIKVKSLTVGDYQVSDDVAIERKTNNDFISSIMDKRLYKQSKDLVENFKKPLMIIEGQEFYSGFIHPNAVRGALASIAIDFGISIIPTRSPEDTAAMIHRIALREQTDEKPNIQLRTEKKPLTTWEQQLYIIESLPNIGPVTAKKLLEEFKSVKNVINASENDLKKIEGIGDKIAERILNVVESSFKTIKNERYLMLKLDNKPIQEPVNRNE